MKRLLTWLLDRTYIHRFPNARLNHFERQFAAANSSPFAAWLSFSEETTSLGLVTDWRGMVEDLEAEGSRLIGAKPCGLRHAYDSGEAIDRLPCPQCKAAV